MAHKYILINPVNVVHDRNVEIFRRALPEYGIKRIYNNRVSWFRDKRASAKYGVFVFSGRLFPKVPRGAFDDVAAVLLFTAQPRVPVCNLVEEAAARRIPVIAVEEVYLMMLSQGLMNNYLLPVDHLFAASDHERSHFIDAGIRPNAVEATGGVFRSKVLPRLTASEKEDLKRELGVPAGMTVVTLSLDVLASSGETREIRAKLLECLAGGLPRDCVLLVKPHPADRHEGFAGFVKEHAPGAIIVPGKLPIDRVLDITDVLFNRGTSQVVLDALDRDVPVACIPLGRKTSFHGVADEVIVSDADDVEKVLSNIKSRGMAIYGALTQKHLSISPAQAIANVSSRIRQIIDTKDLVDTDGRRIELALFWAWLGYSTKAVTSLDRAKPLPAEVSDIADAARRLVCCKAGKEDMILLKRWGGKGYREWILQSLWIKSLYNTRSRVDDKDMEWLSSFPPETNRHQFLPFKKMLEECAAGDGWRIRVNESVRSLLKNAASYSGL